MQKFDSTVFAFPKSASPQKKTSLKVTAVDFLMTVAEDGTRESTR
jgi:hypothetical protein